MHPRSCPHPIADGERDRPEWHRRVAAGKHPRYAGFAGEIGLDKGPERAVFQIAAKGRSQRAGHTGAWQDKQAIDRHYPAICQGDIGPFPLNAFDTFRYQGNAPLPETRPLWRVWLEGAIEKERGGPPVRKHQRMVQRHF